MESYNSITGSKASSLPRQPVYEYPSLVRRYQAVFLDFLFLGSILILLLVLTENWGNGSLVVRVVFLSLLVVYEPVLTTYYATLGQRLMGIRVRHHERPEQRISLGQSYYRVLLKYLLGWMSFISIHFNPSRRAIHDLFSGTVMVRGLKEEVPDYMIHPETGM